MDKKYCKHCGYSWTPRIETEPKACPQCKSPRWSEELRKAGRPKSKKIVVVYSLRGVEIGRHETGDNFTADNLQEWTDWLNDDAVEHPGLPLDADGYQVKGWEFDLIPN
jgi:hypothetical protein